MNTDRETTTDLVDALTNGDETAEAANLPPLTVFDRCDAPGCDAQAYVRARLKIGSHLVFCGHHGHELVPALVGQGAIIRDDTELLVRDRRLS